MLCIECGHQNIPNLYSRYKSEYIRLTTCPRCNRVSDKYIEYDAVILFIDILLLKRGAYRHLAYNINETQIKHASKSKSDARFHDRYRHLIKGAVLIILLDVYLIWATYENSPSAMKRDIEPVLSLSLACQYGFFISQTVLRHVVFNVVIQLVLRYGMEFGKREQNEQIEPRYRCGFTTAVLLTTIMASSSVKLFRILTLIWPYQMSMSLVFGLISVVTTIEALHLVTSFNYLSLTLTVLASLFLQELLTDSFNKFAVNLLML
ncbi:uncharacterized protein LODBEIA_P32890 [Lodderomyces beijingensis]|uniref:Protein ARV n=1 Tax=Lodderomyces beijingensis TaxID=1775926 RepID=A0ABP0ZPC5_9ASCO